MLEAGGEAAAGPLLPSIYIGTLFSLHHNSWQRACQFGPISGTTRSIEKEPHVMGRFLLDLTKNVDWRFFVPDERKMEVA